MMSDSAESTLPMHVTQSRIRGLIPTAIVLFILATRFYHLDLKPFHHDESLFAIYSFNLAILGDYDFQPILHGPFLENIEALIFRLLGDSDVTARLWSAIAGTLLILLVWQLRDRIGRRAALLAAALLAISPTMMFYSRFNRNDVPFTLAAVAFVFCGVRLLQRGKLLYWFLALLTMAWMICIKETYVIFLFAVTSYLVLIGLVEAVARLPLSYREWFKRIAANRPAFWLSFAIATASGAALAFAMIVLLHTTYFRHPEHWDGPLEAIRYWVGQHAEHRIMGEYHYYIPIILVYEFLPLAMLLWGITRLLRRATWLGGCVAWGWAAWSAVFLVALLPYQLPPSMASHIHMTRGWHLWLAIQMLAIGAAASAVLITERKRLAGFSVWWTTGSLLAYAYAGEKVPWISVHIAFPMIFAATMLSCRTGRQPVLESAHRSTQPTSLRNYLSPVLFTLGFAATLVVSLRLCFINCANPAERHVYTHTTREYKGMVKDIHDIVARTNSGAIETFPLILQGDSIWPGQWYFRHWAMMRTGPVTSQSAILIVDEYTDPLHRDVYALKQYPWLTESYIVRRVPFREWWHQDTLFSHVVRLLDIWMALVPKQYRNGKVTDMYGRAVGWIGDRAKLPNMTIEDEIRASKTAWRDVFDYLVIRRDFDSWRLHFRTRNHMAVLLCVRKDLYQRWSRLGGRHGDSRARFVRPRATTE